MLFSEISRKNTVFYTIFFLKLFLKQNKRVKIYINIFQIIKIQILN